MKYTGYIKRQKKYALNNLEEIRERYGSRWVAISEERIIGSGYNHLALIKRMIARAKRLEDLAEPFILANESFTIIIPAQPLLDEGMIIAINKGRRTH